MDQPIRQSIHTLNSNHESQAISVFINVVESVLQSLEIVLGLLKLLLELQMIVSLKDRTLRGDARAAVYACTG